MLRKLLELTLMIELDEFILNLYLFYLFVLLDILPKNQFAANPTKSRKNISLRDVVFTDDLTLTFILL